MNAFPQRPTLADVAEKAGVSTVTVSRVVDGSSKVAAKTRERVAAAMEALGYFGNAAATQLVSGRTQTIAVVTSNIAEFGYASTIRGIEQSARRHEMALLIAVIEGSAPEDIRQTVATVASHALAGVVVIDYDETARSVVPAMPLYLPVVSTTKPKGESRANGTHVYIDDHDGAVIAAEHLIGLGHRSIFVIAPPDYEPMERRSLGTQDALNRARLPSYPVVRATSWRPEAGYEAGQALIENYGDRVTAVACGNDEIALGAIRAFGERGLRVPEDVSVMGFDDSPIAAYSMPALTTMAQDFTSLGSAAFESLRALLAGGEPATPEALRPTLVVRESTAPPNPDRGS